MTPGLLRTHSAVGAPSGAQEPEPKPEPESEPAPAVSQPRTFRSRHPPPAPPRAADAKGNVLRPGAGWSPGVTYQFRLAPSATAPGATFKGFVAGLFPSAAVTTMAAAKAPIALASGASVRKMGSCTNGWTHSAATPRSAVTFRWTAPATNTGATFTFRAIAVRTYGQAWSQVTLSVPPAAAAGTSTTRSGTASRSRTPTASLTASPSATLSVGAPPSTTASPSLTPGGTPPASRSRSASVAPARGEDGEDEGEDEDGEDGGGSGGHRGTRSRSPSKARPRSKTPSKKFKKL